MIAGPRWPDVWLRYEPRKWAIAAVFEFTFFGACEFIAFVDVGPFGVSIRWELFAWNLG